MTRKRWLIVGGIAVAVAAIVLLRLLGGGPTDKVWARIQREGVLRVGMDASYPPFEFVDGEGQFRGLDVDLAQALADRWGVRLEIANVGFDGLYDALRDKKFDLIVSALPYDPFLRKDFAFSYSYFNAGLRWVARPDVLATLGDPSGRRVAVQTGSAADVQARTLQRRFPQMALVMRDEVAQVGEALAVGDADAAILDGVSALQFVAAHPEFAVGDMLLTDEPYVIAMPLDAPTLKREVNAALVDFRESGRLDAWVAAWVGGQ
ncbi:MAG: ABC transporter substrate-binding protein [Anaerolineae bacterium]|nr:ABC transporter substrate-binding protein [Anaerolineae bacterium]